MRDSRTASRKIALCAMLMALAMIFSYVEVLIPINLGVPGIKLGIANLVVVVGLFFLPAGEVLMISVARILLPTHRSNRTAGRRRGRGGRPLAGPPAEPEVRRVSSSTESWWRNALSRAWWRRSSTRPRRR